MRQLNTAPETRRGYYQHWGWHNDADGNRAAHALPSCEGPLADLISTAYHNKTGPDAAFALVLDVDADRTEPRFLDCEGRVDVELVRTALEKHLPVTSHHLTIICRSTSGRGLHLFFSMVPVVLTVDGSSLAEAFAFRVQRSLVAAARELGIGADPSAVGLRRLVANFNNPEKVVFRDQKKRTRIENAAKDYLWSRDPNSGIETPVEPHHALRFMGREIEGFLTQARRSKRLYPSDKNVEVGYARFLCFLAGWIPERLRGELGQLGFSAGHFHGEAFAPVRLSMDELRSVFGDVSAPTIRRILNSRPELAVSHEPGSPLWEIAARPEYWAELEKASDIASRGQGAMERTWASPWDLPQPEKVENGFRNQYLVWLMNAYKSRGYSEEDALAKIRMRFAYCPGAQDSRTWKRLEKKLRNFYKNLPALHGRYADQPLPVWMESDAEFQKTRLPQESQQTSCEEKFLCSEPLSPERGWRHGLFAVPEGSSEEREFQDASPGLREVAHVRLPNEHSLRHLAVVRSHMRVGIFDGDELVFAATNSRHFVVSRALERLVESGRFAEGAVKCWYPKKSHARFAQWALTLDRLVGVPSARSLLGEKATRDASLSMWRERFGLVSKPSRSLSSDVEMNEELPF